jgi:hypothetical protein
MGLGNEKDARSLGVFREIPWASLLPHDAGRHGEMCAGVRRLFGCGVTV